MANDKIVFPNNMETLKTMKLCSLSLVPQREVKRRSHAEQEENSERTGLHATCTGVAAGK